MKKLFCYWCLLLAIACHPNKPNQPTTTPLTAHAATLPMTAPVTAPVIVEAPPTNEEVAQLIFDKVLTFLAKRERVPGATRLLNDKPLAFDLPAGSFRSLWSHDDELFIAGDNGKLFSSQDLGTSWSERPSNTTQHLYALWGRGDSLLIAVGAGGTIITSTDQGETWSLQKSGVKATLRAISGSARNILIVGDSGTILLSSDQGKTWKPQKSGVKTNLLSVWASDNGAYAAGADKLLFSKSGTAWSAQKLPVHYGLRALHGDVSGVYAAGAHRDILQLKEKTWGLRSGLSLDLAEGNISWPDDDEPNYDDLVRELYAEYQDWGGICVRDNVLYLIDEKGLWKEGVLVSPGNFSSLLCATSGAIFAIGESDSTPSAAKLKEAITAKKWTEVAALLKEIKSSNLYVPIARDVAELLAGDLGELPLHWFTDEPQSPSEEVELKALQGDNQTHAVLWFFEGERRAALKESREAQAAYLAALHYAPLETAKARAKGGPCLADVSIKTSPWRGFSSLSEFRAEVFKDLPAGTYVPITDQEIKQNICRFRPNYDRCKDLKPWFYGTIHDNTSGGEDDALHLLLPNADGTLRALLWLYNSATDDLGPGDARESAKITALSSTTYQVSIPHSTLNTYGEEISSARLDIVFDSSGKRVLRMFQRGIPASVVSESPRDLPGNVFRPSPALFFPLSIKLDGDTLFVSGGGCEQSVPLSSLK